jgi:FHA domain-containing protein/IPT/TIG domain-containing protein
MTASLTVLSGPLAGTRLDIDGSEDDLLVGSDVDCRLALDLPGVSPIHARLSLDQGGLIVHDTHSPRGLYVNDTRVSGQAPLRDGDVLWLGTPGDETSVMLQCRVAGAALPVVVMPEEPASDAVVFADAGPADAVDPMADLGDPLATAPTEMPPASPVAAAPEAPSEDVFFMEEPAAPAAPPVPVKAAIPPPPPPSPPPPAQDDLFFVEEPLAPPASPPAAPAAPARPAPAPEPPPVPPPKAKAAAAPPRPIRRHGPTPPPSAAPERDDEAEPARPRSVPPRPASTPRAAAASGARRSSPPVALIAGGAALLLVAVGAGVMFLRGPRAPAITSITPARVGLGQSVTIAGTAFGATPQANVVSFGGKPGRVVQASPTRLQVEIPEIPAAAGRDTPVPVVVVVDGHESKPATVAVFETPRIHGISPTVAMPGEELVLAGTGWGAGATVQFGSVPATVLDSSPTSLKVTVPALPGAPGTEFPVRVTMGADTSNPAPFVLGHLPLLLSISPASAAPGDVVTVAGRGFDVKPSANDVRVGSTRALVAAASGSELKVIVPRATPGETTVEVRLPGVEHVGQSRLVVAAAPDPVDLRFVAEPFEDTPGHEHAVLTTGLGPAFVLSASGGRSVAERALEAQRRLNEAGAALKGTVDGDVRARGLEGSPSLVVAGRNTPLLDVTIDDAAGYEEDWTGLKDRAGPLSPARVAVWWEAVARDLVLLLVRGDKPHFAADLAPEGRVLADLQALARKSVAVGVPRQVIAEARPPMRDALRTVGLRIPVSVKEPSGAAPTGGAPPAGAATAGPAAGPALRLDGRWSGSETDSGRQTYITAVFAGTGGTFTYERALSVTQPLLGVVQQKGAVRFSVQTGAGPRYYQGKWDGQKLTGTVSVDPGGKTPVGTFELSPG